jgi:hypothetical protein
MSNERTTDDVPPHKPRATRFEHFIPRADDEDDPRLWPPPEAPIIASRRRSTNECTPLS